MRAMKDSGIEWIGEIPVGWDVVRLKKCCALNKGLSITKADLIEFGSPVISYGQIHSKYNNWINISDDLVRYVNPFYEFSNPSAFAREGDIIFADTSEDYDGIGNCIYVNLSQGIFAGYHTIIVSPFNFECPKYLAFLFQTDCWRSQIRSVASGIKVFSVTQKMLKNTTLLVPSVNEQQRIAEYLDNKCAKIDSIIEKQKAVIEKLKEYKLSIITEAVTKGLNPDVEMKDSGIEWVDNIPNTWENRKMISVLAMRVIDGPHESPELFDEGIPYISATAIEDGKINFSKMRGYISEEYCDICDVRYKPQINDILVIKLGASTGQVGIVETEERFNIWVPLAAIRCNEKAEPRFVYYAFQSDYFWKQMELSWTFGTQQTLGVKTIERLRILLPEIKEQKEIVEYLDKRCIYIDSAIQSKQTIIEKLTAYKKSLIYEVVTGKKEV